MRHDPKHTDGKHLKSPRYSKLAFDAHGLDTAEAQRLSEQLAHEVLIELTRAASNRLAEIVGELNALGHQLVRHEGAPGDVEYRDMANANPCALRLGFRVTTDAGFANLTDASGEPIAAVPSWGGGGSPRGNRE